MKIVFLDFDGCLNSDEYIDSERRNERGGVVGLDEVAVLRFNKLIDETGAQVVVSSTWRHNRSTKALQILLNDLGFKGTVLGRTPRFLKTENNSIYAAGCRGQEIQAWLDGAPDYGITVDQFVIIDDDSDMDHLHDRLVKTQFATGLLDEHVDKAIEMLMEKPKTLILPSAEDVERLAK